MTRQSILVFRDHLQVVYKFCYTRGCKYLTGSNICRCKRVRGEKQTDACDWEQVIVRMSDLGN